jgi:HlyD family secretion protein
MAEGSIHATNPPSASVTVQPEGADAVKMGQAASISVSGKILHGEVSSIAMSNGTVGAVISLSEPLPANAPIGTQVGALIDIGILRDVVFFARPATAKSHAEAFQFVIDRGGTSASRVRVQYGRQSGPLIEIISGLSPGDRVIVTDTSAWDSSPRILIEENEIALFFANQDLFRKHIDSN